jgi:hypothetical protein
MAVNIDMEHAEEVTFEELYERVWGEEPPTDVPPIAEAGEMMGNGQSNG